MADKINGGLRVRDFPPVQNVMVDDILAKETPAGAQAKATAALNSAKAYTDAEVIAAVKAGAVNPRGAWSAATAYAKHDMVSHSGNSWYADEATVAGEEPGVNAKWINYAGGIDLATANAAYSRKTYDLREWLPVDWVSGDGVTTELNQAIADLNALRTAGNAADGLPGSSNPSGGQPRLKLHNARMGVANVNVGAYIDIDAQQTILFNDSLTDNILQGVGYQAILRGMRFRGGARQIAVATGNVDIIVISVDDCHFDNPNVAGVDIDATSASIFMAITRSRMVQTQTGDKPLFVMGSGDKVVIRDFWVQSAADYTFKNNGGSLTIKDGIGVPLNSAGAWVYAGADKVNVSMKRFRAGGEFGGKPLADWHGIPGLGGSPDMITHFDVDDCQVNGRPIARFYDLPNRVKIADSQGFTATNPTGLYFDAAIPAATKRAIGSNVRISVDGNVKTTRLITRDSDKTVAQLISAQLPHTQRRGTGYLTVDDVVLTLLPNTTGLGKSVAGADTTVTQPTNTIGRPAYNVVCTADEGWRQVLWTTALDGFAAGPYTLLVELESKVGIPKFIVYAADRATIAIVAPGERTLVAVPFVYDSAIVSDKRIGILVQEMLLNDEVQWASHRIVKGFVTPESIEPCLTVYGEADPTSGHWLQGDRIEDPTPTAGGKRGRICVATGISGTWKPYGAIDA